MYRCQRRRYESGRVRVDQSCKRQGVDGDVEGAGGSVAGKGEGGHGRRSGGRQGFREEQGAEGTPSPKYSTGVD